MKGTVRAGGAVGLPVLARQAAAAGLSGLEFYVGIPGTVGGAVRMNAGGHGQETREVLISARVVDLLGDGLGVDRAMDELALGYRTSSIGPSQVVAGATFRVGSDDARRVRGAHHRDRPVAPGEPTRRCERGIRVPKPAR